MYELTKTYRDGTTTRDRFEKALDAKQYRDGHWMIVKDGPAAQRPTSYQIRWINAVDQDESEDRDHEVNALTEPDTGAFAEPNECERCGVDFDSRWPATPFYTITGAWICDECKEEETV
jgi:hypothetical protein